MHAYVMHTNVLRAHAMRPANWSYFGQTSVSWD
jgi:hypothetical protein